MITQRRSCTAAAAANAKPSRQTHFLLQDMEEKSESGNRIMIMIRFFVIATTEPYSTAENLQLFETLPSNSSSATPAFFALLSQCIHALMTFR